MLLNNFFYIESIEQIEQAICARIRINPSHAIFEGHFPGQPVVPGVCMLEMLKEVIQESFQKKYRLESASVIKFLTMFTPPQFILADFEIKFNSLEPSKLSIQATLKYEEHVFLKFTGTYIELS